MEKIIVLSFDIPLNKSSQRVKIWRMLKETVAKQELGSYWVAQFNQKNLANMKTIAREIINSGGNARLIVGERVI